MLAPTRQQLHVNALLTKMSIGYQQTQDIYIADKAFPSLPVKKQSDRYLVYKKGDWLRALAGKRAPATESIGINYSLDNTPTYFCNIWSVHHDIPDEDFDNADDVINVQEDAVALTTQNTLLRRELVWASSYMQPGIWQGYHPAGTNVDFLPNSNGAGYWGSATSNPAADIALGKVAVQSSTGWVPNTLVMTSDVWYALSNNPNLIDRYKFTREGILTQDLVAGVFGVDRILILQAVINTAQENQPDQIAFLARNCALLCYAAPSPGLRRPSAGYTFSWTGRRNAGGSNTTVKSMYMETKNATRVEAEVAFDMKMTGPDLGVFYSQVLSAS